MEGTVLDNLQMHPEDVGLTFEKGEHELRDLPSCCSVSGLVGMLKIAFGTCALPAVVYPRLTGPAEQLIIEVQGLMRAIFSITVRDAFGTNEVADVVMVQVRYIYSPHVQSAVGAH